MDEVVAAGLPGPPITFYDPNDPYKIADVVTVQKGRHAYTSISICKHRFTFSKASDPHICLQTEALLLGQWHHQLILRRAVERLGGIVELGTALAPEGITQDNDAVIGKLQKMMNGAIIEETAHFKYIVGADGAHSTCEYILSCQAGIHD